MRKRIILIILAVCLICSACTSLRRYYSLKVSGSDNTLADIELNKASLVPDAPGEGNKSLWDLSADAQSQFIKILDKRFTDNGKFLGSLSYEYMKPDSELIPDDYINKDLRLIFSVSKKREYLKTNVCNHPELSPADRLEYIKISLSIKDPCLKFKEWNLYATEYGSIDIGSVSFSRSLDLDASQSLTNKETEPVKGLTTGIKSSFSRKEDQSLKYRYLKLNGKLYDNEIQMEEEGTRELDLTGNIIAEVSFRFDETNEIITKLRGLRDSSGDFCVPDKLLVDSILVAIPDIRKIKKDIQADLRMDFIYRNVKRGRKTFPEWDDRVKYLKGNCEKTVSLFKDSAYVPKFYCIGTGQGGNRKEFIGLNKGDVEIYPLIFGTFKEAAAFYPWLLHWLKLSDGNPLRIGGHVLKFNNMDLTYKQVNEARLFGIVPYYW